MPLKAITSPGNGTPIPFITVEIHNLLKFAQPRCKMCHVSADFAKMTSKASVEPREHLPLIIFSFEISAIGMAPLIVDLLSPPALSSPFQDFVRESKPFLALLHLTHFRLQSSPFKAPEIQPSIESKWGAL